MLKGEKVELLSESLEFYRSHQAEVITALVKHLQLSLVALVLALLLGISLGILAARNRLVAQYGVGFFNGIRVVPSLSILVLFLPLLGLGFFPALLALTILAIPPILLATYTGITGVDEDTLEAARGLGMSNRMILFRVQLPLALSSIVGGTKVAAIEVIASASLAAYIGAGGLGDYIIMGLGLYNVSIMLVGAIPIAVLAIVSQLLFIGLERVVRVR